MPDQKDQCKCECPCPNGPAQVMVGQVLVFMGLWFSLATIADCRFALIDGGFTPSGVPEQFQDLRRGVGFFTFEGFDGTCYFYNDNGDFLDENVIVEIYNQYMDFLTSSWGASRAFACIATILAWLTWFYMLSFSCSAQMKPFRYFVSAILSVVLVICQGIAFSVLNTDWCSANNCEFSRSAGFSVGALLCFFFGGVSFFLTTDYPGVVDDVQPVAYAEATKEEVQDEEQPAEAAVEEEEEDVTKEVGEEDPTEEAEATVEEATTEEADATAEPVENAADESVEVSADDVTDSKTSVPAFGA